MELLASCRLSSLKILMKEVRMKTLKETDLYHSVRHNYLNRIFKRVHLYKKSRSIDVKESELEKALWKSELNQVGEKHE